MLFANIASVRKAIWCRACGWTGLALHNNTTALVRHMPRDVALYDGDLHVCHWGALYPPTAVCFTPEGHTLVTAEGPEVALRDPRSGGGAVLRLSGGLGCAALHAVDCAVMGGSTIIGKDHGRWAQSTAAVSI